MPETLDHFTGLAVIILCSLVVQSNFHLLKFNYLASSVSKEQKAVISLIYLIVRRDSLQSTYRNVILFSIELNIINLIYFFFQN